jgi:hypothetical protein
MPAFGTHQAFPRVHLYHTRARVTKVLQILKKKKKGAKFSAPLGIVFIILEFFSCHC